MDKATVTGLVLAGGQGSRMGGVDKGLQSWQGQPLVCWSLQRLREQQDLEVAELAISANRHLDVYSGFHVPVWPDSEALPSYPGPVGGLLAGLMHCETPWLLTVPCDSPRFPLDVLSRLYAAVSASGSDLAMPQILDEAGIWQPQPVFCLIRKTLLPSLQAFALDGGRKLGAWARQQGAVMVPFEDRMAFFNANTLEDLEALPLPDPV